MDYNKLAKQYIEDALKYGEITINGETRVLRTSEILALCKYIAKDGWVASSEAMINNLYQHNNLPSEMLILEKKQDSLDYLEEIDKDGL